MVQRENATYKCEPYSPKICIHTSIRAACMMLWTIHYLCMCNVSLTSTIIMYWLPYTRWDKIRRGEQKDHNTPYSESIFILLYFFFFYLKMSTFFFSVTLLLQDFMVSCCFYINIISTLENVFLLPHLTLFCCVLLLNEWHRGDVEITFWSKGK